MPERLDSFPPHRGRRYAWDEMAKSGAPYKMRRGDDFDAPPRKFRNRFYTQAKLRGLKARSAMGTDPDGVEYLIVQFYDPKPRAGV
jgi:hypothetical protein